MNRSLYAHIVAWLLFIGPVLAQADEVDDYIKAEMQKRQIPGLTLVVVKAGKVIKQQAYGLASIELNVPATTETVYQIASITKIFTSAAIMTLVEEGKLSLDDKVLTLLPDLPSTWRDMTVRHLLTHTSGLPDVTDNEGITYIANTREEALKKVSALPLVSHPGERRVYNQTGYVLLGLIIEKLSGLPFEEFLAQRFFRPLGMTSTRFGDSKEILPGRASLYTRFEIRDNQFVKSPDRLWTGRYLYPNYQHPGAGLNTTVGDLVKWDIALSAGRILKPSILDQMWTPVTLNDGTVFRFKGTAYGAGCGWRVSDHPGHKVVRMTGGGSTAYARFLDDKLTIVLLTNCQSGEEPDSLLDSVATLYIPALAQGAK